MQALKSEETLVFETSYIPHGVLESSTELFKSQILEISTTFPHIYFLPPRDSDSLGLGWGLGREICKSSSVRIPSSLQDISFVCRFQKHRLLKVQ